MAEGISATRRDAIKYGLAALAGVGISALAPAQAFAGVDGDVVLAASNNAGASDTSITSSTGGQTLNLYNSSATTGSGLLVAQSGGGNAYASRFYHTGSGPCIQAQNAGSGLAIDAYLNNGSSSNVMSAQTNGSGNVILAQIQSSSSDGAALRASTTGTVANSRAIYGEMKSTAATGWAIEGKSAGSSGGAIWAQVTAAGAGHAIRGSMFGTGPCMDAVIDNAENTNPALTAHTNGTGLSIDAYAQGTGTVIKAENFNIANTSPVIKAVTNGNGNVIEATTSGEGAAVYAKASGQDSNAVYAFLDNASGYEAAVYARTSGSGDGVEAWSMGSGIGCGVRAIAGPAAAYGVHAEGGKAQLYLKPAAITGPPTTNAHQLGELFMDATGKLYSCSVAGTPGTWVPVINTSTATTVPKTISQANADYVLMVQQTGTGYALQAVGAQALRVDGALSMSRAGRAKIGKGKKSVTVTVPGGVGTAANVICTMQGSAGTIRYAKRYSPTKIKIQLTKAATSTCYVAWMVLG